MVDEREDHQAIERLRLQLQRSGTPPTGEVWADAFSAIQRGQSRLSVRVKEAHQLSIAQHKTLLEAIQSQSRFRMKVLEAFMGAGRAMVDIIKLLIEKFFSSPKVGIVLASAIVILAMAIGGYRYASYGDLTVGTPALEASP